MRVGPGGLRPWNRFAFDAEDSAEDRVEKRAAFVVAAPCCVAGVVWAAMYVAVFGWGIAAALPMVFVVVVGGALVVSHVRRDYRYAVYAQIVCIIAIPTLIQWNVGGVSASGLVLVWAFVGPMTALVFFPFRQALLWFGVFLVAVLITFAFDDVFASSGLDVSESTSLVFGFMNLAAASAVVFAFAAYFVTQATAERERSNRLLLNVLPASIALVLKESDSTIAERFDSASVLFADVVGSTPLFANLDPVEAVDWLNEVFSEFDRLLEEHQLEKIRTIGDNYMVSAGAPARRDDHAPAAVSLGLDMLDVVQRIPARDGQRLEFRVGINSGPLVAGVIGTHRFHYDVWGDTVNTASRMESHGEAGRVHITRATHDLLGNEFDCEQRGTIDIRGKGRMDTWFVTRSDRPLVR